MSARAEVNAHRGAAAVVLMLVALPCSLVSKLLAGYQELHRDNYAACAGAVAGLADWRSVSSSRLHAGAVRDVCGLPDIRKLTLLIWVVVIQKPWLFRA